MLQESEVWSLPYPRGLKPGLKHQLHAGREAKPTAKPARHTTANKWIGLIEQTVPKPVQKGGKKITWQC